MNEIAGDRPVESMADAPAPLRALLILAELPNTSGGFTVELVLSFRDPNQQVVDENAPQMISVVDAVAMVLVDIIETTPAAFRERLDALQTRFTRVAERVAGGEDARTAAQEEFAGPLVDGW